MVRVAVLAVLPTMERRQRYANASQHELATDDRFEPVAVIDGERAQRSPTPAVQKLQERQAIFFRIG
jgi:hypothetical protein